MTKFGNGRLRDVAALAGVSPSTASKVLSCRLGNARIASQTRDRILAAARELNYVPNVHARRLFRQHSGVIGLVVPSYRRLGSRLFDDRHLVGILAGLEVGLTRGDCDLLLLFNDENFRRRRRFISLFQEHNVDGLLIWGVYGDEQEWTELAAAQFPYLFLTNLPGDRKQWNYIGSDFAGDAGRLLAVWLAQGCRRFGWLGGKPEISPTRWQEEGMARTLAAAGIDFAAVPKFYGDYQPAAGYANMSRLLETGMALDAVIAADTNIAVGALRCLRERNRQLPVAALDGLDADAAEYGICCVVPDDEQIGELAVGQLLALVEGRSENVQMKLPGRLRLEK